jgi:hypothetical protein
VFSDYLEVDGLVVPVYYETYTVAEDGTPRRGAIHIAWNVSVTGRFDASRTRRPAEALVDTLTMRWWGMTARN